MVMPGEIFRLDERQLRQGLAGGRIENDVDTAVPPTDPFTVDMQLERRVRTRRRGLSVHTCNLLE